MSDRSKIEKIFELYYKPPFQMKIIMESVQNSSIENLVGIIHKEIIPNVFSLLSDKEKMRKEKESSYIRELVNAMVDAEFLKLKKKSYHEFIRDSLNPPDSRNKTNEDYLKEHKDYLKSVLIPTDKKHNYTEL